MHTKLENIAHDIYQKTQQNKTPNRTLSVDIESTMNLFFPTTFLPKTLSGKLDFCLLTLMKLNVLEFDADIKNRIFYALNIIYQYHFIFISNFTHVAALLFELLLSLHISCSLHFDIRVKMAANHNNA